MINMKHHQLPVELIAYERPHHPIKTLLSLSVYTHHTPNRQTQQRDNHNILQLSVISNDMQFGTLNIGITHYNMDNINTIVKQKLNA